jgi:hypothetical protein
MIYSEGRLGDVAGKVTEAINPEARGDVQQTNVLGFSSWPIDIYDASGNGCTLGPVIGQGC